MNYKIGKVQDPRDTDPTFNLWEEALSHAITMSGEDEWVIAIWLSDGFIEALVYQGGVYMP